MSDAFAQQQLAIFYTLKRKCEVFLETWYFRSPFFFKQEKRKEKQKERKRKEKNHKDRI